MNLKQHNMSLYERILSRLSDGGKFSVSHLGITFYQKQDVIPTSARLDNEGAIAHAVQEWAKRSVHNNSSFMSFVIEGDIVKIYY